MDFDNSFTSKFIFALRSIKDPAWLWLKSHDEKRSSQGQLVRIDEGFSFFSLFEGWTTVLNYFYQAASNKP